MTEAFTRPADTLRLSGLQHLFDILARARDLRSDAAEVLAFPRS